MENEIETEDISCLKCPNYGLIKKSSVKKKRHLF